MKFNLISFACKIRKIWLALFPCGFYLLYETTSLSQIYKWNIYRVFRFADVIATRVVELALKTPANDYFLRYRSAKRYRTPPSHFEQFFRPCILSTWSQILEIIVPAAVRESPFVIHDFSRITQDHRATRSTLNRTQRCAWNAKRMQRFLRARSSYFCSQRS